MASSTLSLKWNNHKATFVTILSKLQKTNQYDDATVACDGKLYPVHRLVLSACSSYFEEMFNITHGKHSIIVLKDITSDVFEALLSYMYIGEVEVKREVLSELIAAAHCLQVKGLSTEDVEEESCDISYTSAETPNNTRRTVVATKRPYQSLDNSALQKDCLRPAAKMQKLTYHSVTGSDSCASSSTGSGMEKQQPRCFTAESVLPTVESGTSSSNSFTTEVTEAQKSPEPNKDLLMVRILKEEVADGDGSNHLQANHIKGELDIIVTTDVNDSMLQSPISHNTMEKSLNTPSLPLNHMDADCSTDAMATHKHTPPAERVPSTLLYYGVKCRIDKQLTIFPNGQSLQQYLEKSKIGAGLIHKYRLKGTFTSVERSKLVAIIIDGLLETFDRLQNCHLEQVANEFVETFPYEPKEMYYLPPMSPMNRISKGKLVDRYRNQRRYHKALLGNKAAGKPPPVSG